MMFNHADGDPILVLDEEQCWQLLEGTTHGRLVVTVAGEPDIFPVNYVTSRRKLYFRTAPGNKLAEAEELGLASWVPTLKDFYVEIDPGSVSGRHFQFGEQPERDI